MVHDDLFKELETHERKKVIQKHGKMRERIGRTPGNIMDIKTKSQSARKRGI